MIRTSIKTIAVATAMWLSAIAVSGADNVDYENGIFIINEDWYGHQNSTVNFLHPDDADGDYWQYRVVQSENPGKELGCTNQYGTLWNGRLYLIAKQDKDPGAAIAGGRITVCDAKTMKILHQQSLIDPSGKQCDGRGFVGVDEHKGYISTSNGIWVFDLDTYTFTGQVEGSANPNAGDSDDKPATDPTGSLYHGQSGTMVLADGRVFAAHQQYGLLVIDPSQDKVTDVISMDIVREKAGIGSVVKSKDGMLWLSVAKDCQGTGSVINCLVRINPETLDTKIIECPDGIYGPANSWYAWTPDAFVASRLNNRLYWKGGKDRWFSGTKVFRYDIDSDKMELFTDLESEGQDWKIYGCSLGVDPRNEDVYMSLYHEFSIPTYITRRYSSEGEIIKDYEMIQNYWFPSNMVFVNNDESGMKAVSAESSCSISWNGNALSIFSDSDTEAFVYSINGQLVTQYKVDSGQNSYPVNLAHGFYIVRINSTVTKILVD